MKAAGVAQNGPGSVAPRTASQPFEIWRDKNRLPDVLRNVFSRLSLDAVPAAMALTMTAELSDVFETKRQGVQFVLQAFDHCFPDREAYALNTSGNFVRLKDAPSRALEFAATNWIATAAWVAKRFEACLVVDVGSTTTDIIPVADGKIAATGRTDLERLISGELIFTGVLRTNLSSIVQRVPVRGQSCRVASEFFAISGDVHLILGHLPSGSYICPTPDGQEPTLASARRRLARLVCADVETLSAADIDAIARHISDQQVRQIRDGMNQVLLRSSRFRNLPVVLCGIGAFLAHAAARTLGLEIVDTERFWNCDESAVAPCVAAANLLAEQMRIGAL